MNIEIGKINIAFMYDRPENEDIKRCLGCLYQVPAGTCPLERDFGLSFDILSLPMDAAKNEIAVEIIEKTEKYEPRAKVERVDFKTNENGALEVEVILR